jgi:hypothetical protein
MDIYAFSDGTILRVIIGIFLFIGIVGCLSIGRRFDKFFKLNSDTNGTIGAFLAVTGVFYGILFGLVIISVWDTYDKVGGLVQSEASSLRQLYSMSVLADEKNAHHLRDYEREYAQVVINKEWPAQRAGNTDPSQYLEGYKVLQKIRADGFALNQEGGNAGALARNLSDALDKLTTARDQRISQVAVAIPGKLWAALFVLTAVNMILLWLIRIENILLDVILNSAVSLAIGVIFAFCFIVDHPFKGNTSIDSSAIESVYKYEMGG